MTQLILTYSNQDYNLDINNQDIVQKKSIAEIGNPNSVKSTITRTFRVYKSNNNRDVMQNLGLNGVNNFLVNNEVKGRIIENGVEIMSNASIYISNDIDFWKVILKKGNGLFFDEIKGFSIRDLDLTIYEQQWTLTNIINNRSNTTGINYPIINWGTLNIARHSEYVLGQELYPSIFVKNIIDAILNKNTNPALNESWILKSGKDFPNYKELLSDDNYLNLVMPVIDNLTRSDITANYLSIGTTTSNETAILGTPKVLSYPIKTDIYGFFQSANYFVDRDTDNGEAYYIRIDTRETANFSFKLSLIYNISGNAGTGIVNAYVELWKNWVIESSKLYTLDTSVSISQDSTDTINYNDINVDSDDFLYIGIKVTSLGSGAGSHSFTAKSGTIFEVTQANFERIGFRGFYPLAINLPNFTQVDFFKNIMSMFGIIPDIDDNERTVTLRRFDELFGNRDSGNINEFTEKLDLFKEKGRPENIRNKYNFSSLGKDNEFTYKIDSNIAVNEDIRSYKFLLIGQNYIGIKKFIELDFAATEISNRLTININIPDIPILIWDNYDISAYEISITYFAGGGILVNCFSIDHGLQTGQKVKITNTTNYNGTYTISYEDKDNFLISAIYISDELGFFFRLPGIKIDKSFEPRILRLNIQTLSNALNYSDDFGSTKIPLTTNIPLAEFVNYIDPESLINEYWDNYINMINEPDTPEPKINIDLEDFINFSHFKPVYLLGNYYFAYEISKFIKDQSSEFKLIKI